MDESPGQEAAGGDALWAPAPEELQVAVFAGDASGDLQASLLLSHLKRRIPGLSAWGIGGRHLREAGMDLVFDTSRSSAIGFVQVARMIPDMLRLLKQSSRLLEQRRPDLMLAVDAGAFNLRITPQARAMGIPVAYWFPPGSWRRNPPGERIVNAADFFISPYPWYAENLRAAGAEAVFLGHPLLDQVRARMDREAFLRRMDLPVESRLVGLLPGSRGHEVRYILPVMLEAAGILFRQQPDLSFIIPVSNHFPADEAAQMVRRYVDVMERRGVGAPPVALARSATQEALCHASAAAVCSGSATLEALIAGTPMVVVYRGSGMMKLEYRLRRMNIVYMGMPNILADRMIVPELRQDDATGEAIAAHLLDLVQETDARREQLERLSEIRKLLEPPGALERTADALTEWYRRQKNSATHTVAAGGGA